MKHKATALLVISLFINAGGHAGITAILKHFKTPAGFVYISSGEKNKTAFYIQREPVSQAAYAAFIADLIKSGQSHKADLAIASLLTAPDKTSKQPVVLKGERGSLLYAEWLENKLSNKKVKVQCKPLSYALWSVVFSEDINWDEPNVYGLKRSNLNERVLENDTHSLILDQKGKVSIASIDGTFRLTLTPLP